MPFDQSNNRVSRPLAPTILNTPPNKAGKTPLAPRIAAAASSPISPVLRRGPQLPKGSPPKGVSQDEISTPVKAFLNSNVTPRSSSRKARVDSGNSTPNDTPNGAPKELRLNTAIAAPLLAKHSILNPNGLEFQGDIVARKRPASVIGDGRSQYERRPPESIPGRRPEPLGTKSTIFHADDAKSALAQSPPTSGKLESHLKSPCFFYANGDSLEPELASPSLQSGFSQLTRTPPSSGPPSVVSARRRESVSSHIINARDASDGRRQAQDETRSPSPADNASISSTHNKQSPSPSGIPVRIQGQADNNRPDSRLGGSRILGPWMHDRKSSHGRSASVGSVEGNIFKRRTNDPSSASSTPSTKASKRVSFPLVAASPKIPEPCIDAPSNQPLSASPTPAKPSVEDSPKHKLEQMNELAANARRERKVLDLEISNSSLMAINRTLEREMRKQNAELRRFRRLSRSGRLSLAAPGSKLPRPCRSSGLSTAPTDLSPDLGGLLSDQSESETSETDSVDETSSAEVDEARHRERDEKRLQLDLAKHQRLLIDSQKMNQSLKKCLGWTEELIKEGKKALDFKVRVSDIQFGGKVLMVDEIGVDHHAHVIVQGKDGENL